MAGIVHEKVRQSLQAAEGLYHRLVLLVGETGSGKTGVLRGVAEELGTSVININLALAGELLELTAKQRSLRLPGILDRIAARDRSPVVLDNLEIIFDKDLKQDPLRLLQSLSRNRTVLASWNGTMNSGRLLYAETGHPEYRSYESIDVLIGACVERLYADRARCGPLHSHARHQGGQHFQSDRGHPYRDGRGSARRDRHPP